MKNLKYWIWFSRLENLSPKKQLDLLKKFGEPKELYNKSKEELMELEIKEAEVDKILKPEYRNNLGKYIEYMKENNIQTITIKDKYYPEKLKQIYDPPVVLFLKGSKEILNEKSIAIVGCRLCTNYGKEVSINIAYNLALNNINVISGLARGIDTYSHIGTLKANGKTIGVLGCGLDRIYPEENKKLSEEIILKGGAIISEYVIGTKPLAKNFPRRNRIISGMSDGVVVVEARQKSGTLITVDFAQEQGKEIYVVPGNITSQNSYGTNELIKQGAKLVTSTADILEDLL